MPRMRQGSRSHRKLRDKRNEHALREIRMKPRLALLTGVLFCAFIFSALARTLAEPFHPELTFRR